MNIPPEAGAAVAPPKAPQVRRGSGIRPGSAGEPRRYQIRFPNREALVAARSAEGQMPTVFRPVVEGQRQAFLSVEIPTALPTESAIVDNEDRTLTLYEREFGAEIVEDFQFTMDLTEVFDPELFEPESEAAASLDDVIEKIRASECWEESRGEGVVIAVVDTGVDGRRPEFPLDKRAGAWQDIGETPWTDWEGHGTMCATIAAGTRRRGGVFDGVAPDARVIACKTKFYDSQLAAVYEYLTDRAVNEELTIVATNSFGYRTGSPPPAVNPLLIPALDDAIEAGVQVFFSAGNYHELVAGAEACGPTSIWQHKCRADVMTVATCRLDGIMWPYSSRGLGQLFDQSDCNEKPDVTAPTPADGKIVYGNRVIALPNGWGTSGACPQVAGLAALLLSRQRNLTHAEVFDAIRDTAVPLGHAPACEGRGRIDCRAALDAVI